MVRPFQVYAFCIVGNCCPGNVSYDVQNALVRVHCVFKIKRGIVVGFFVAEIALLEFDNALHQWVVQLETQFGVIRIIVGHSLFAVFLVILN